MATLMATLGLIPEAIHKYPQVLPTILTGTLKTSSHCNAELLSILNKSDWYICTGCMWCIHPVHVVPNKLSV